jgi:hypothetical protein
MNARSFVLAATAAAAAIVLVPAAGVFAKDAKDDPNAVRAAVIKDYKAQKKYVTADCMYFIDSTKVDSRWAVDDPKPMTDPNQGLMLHGNLAPVPANTAIAINVEYLKCIQETREGSTRHPFTHEFKAAGKVVELKDISGYVQAWWDEEMKTLVEPQKDKSSKGAEKCDLGPAKLRAWVVGTDKESKQKVRKDLFMWTRPDKAGTWTYWVEAQMPDKLFIDAAGKVSDDYIPKLDTFLKQTADLKDPRLK